MKVALFNLIVGCFHSTPYLQWPQWSPKEWQNVLYFSLSFYFILFTKLTFQPNRFLVSKTASHIMHNISFENVKVSKLATEVHTWSLSDSSCMSLYASVTIYTAGFGPQEDRLFSFGEGEKTWAEERRCLACNNLPWDYSILFHSRTVIPLRLFTLGWSLAWKARSILEMFFCSKRLLNKHVFCMLKVLFFFI